MTALIPLPQRANLSRRVLGGLFFAGYALAACSVSADPITTDAQGLITEETIIPANPGLPVYVARPDSAGRHPAVLVVSEVFGIHAYIKDICRRLAKLGYVAIAPAFFHRYGDPAQLATYAEVEKLVNKAKQEEVDSDVDATVRWLEKQEFVTPNRLAITGFCWGGGLVWRSCAGTRAFKAGVAWYGDLGPEDPNADLGAWQEQLAASLNCPVLGLYGDRDQYISREQIASMQTRLGKARHKSEIIVYPDVGHGFHADYRSGYVKAAAEDAWARMLAWFEANGV